MCMCFTDPSVHPPRSTLVDPHNVNTMWLASLVRREQRSTAGILVCLLDPIQKKTWIHVHINGWIVHRTTLLQSGSRPLCYSQATYSTKQLFWSIHEPNRIVELWLSKHKSLLWACIRKSFILDRAYDPFYKIEYFEQTISNMTLYKCSSVWSCIVISISTQQYTSSLH